MIGGLLKSITTEYIVGYYGGWVMGILSYDCTNGVSELWW